MIRSRDWPPIERLPESPGRTVVKSHIQGHSAVQPAFLTRGFLRHPGAIVQPKNGPKRGGNLIPALTNDEVTSHGY